MTYYIGNENTVADLLGADSPRFFYALRRTDDGLLYFGKIDQLKDVEAITINDPGLAAEDFEEFEYGVDFFDGRLALDHSRPYANLHWDQFRWDTKNMYYYINANGEFVVRINQKYQYDVSFVGAISGTTLTVDSIDSGVFEIGMTIQGPFVIENTTIVAQLTGNFGSVGTYTVSEEHTTPPLPSGELIATRL
jgi:hypothetical protein